MFSIKLILGGIGLLVFAIICILTSTLLNRPFFLYLCIMSAFIGIVLVIGGLLSSDNNENDKKN